MLKAKIYNGKPAVSVNNVSNQEKIGFQYDKKALSNAIQKWKQHRLIPGLSLLPVVPQEYKPTKNSQDTLDPRDIKSVLLKWKEYTKKKVLNEHLRRKAIRFRYFHLLRLHFKQFKVLVYELPILIMKNNAKAERLYQQILSRRVLLHWRNVCKYKKLKKQVQVEIEYSILRKQLASTVHEWLYYASRRLLWRTLQERSITHYESHLRRRSFREWFQYTRAKNLYYKGLLEQAVVHQQNKLLTLRKTAFNGWMDLYKSKLVQHIQHIRAIEQFHRTNMKKCMRQWIEYSALQRKCRVMESRATLFRQRVVYTIHWKLWKRFIQLQRQCRMQVLLSLEHWKVSLEKQVFKRWKGFVLEKIQKSKRLRHAFQFRQQSLREMGMRRWTAVSQFLQENRIKNVCEHQADHTAKIWRIVANCARHWRYVARKQKILKNSVNVIDSYWPKERRPEYITTSISSCSEYRPRMERPTPRAFSMHQEEEDLDSTRRDPLGLTHSTGSTRPRPRKPIEYLYGYTNTTINKSCDAPLLDTMKSEGTVNEFSFLNASNISDTGSNSSGGFASSLPELRDPLSTRRVDNMMEESSMNRSGRRRTLRRFGIEPENIIDKSVACTDINYRYSGNGTVSEQENTGYQQTNNNSSTNSSIGETTSRNAMLTHELLRMENEMLKLKLQASRDSHTQKSIDSIKSTKAMVDLPTVQVPLPLSIAEETKSIELKLLYWKDKKQLWNRHLKTLEKLKSEYAVMEQPSNEKESLKYRILALEERKQQHEQERSLSRLEIQECIQRIQCLRLKKEGL